MSPQPRSRRRTASLIAIFSAIAIALAMAVPATAAVLVGTKNIRNGAVTAKKIKNGAVNAKKIKKNAVNGKKIRKNAVKPRHVAPKTMNYIANNIATEGPQGPAGLSGVEAQKITLPTPNVDPGEGFQRWVTCEDDKTLLSGGATWIVTGAAGSPLPVITNTYPSIDPGPNTDGETVGIMIHGVLPGSNVDNYELRAQLVCADVDSSR